LNGFLVDYTLLKLSVWRPRATVVRFLDEPFPHGCLVV
jgi:hypothetical protein